VAKRTYLELRTLIALPDPAARKTLRKSLQEQGLLHCREIGELPALAEKIGQADPDLLITLLDDSWNSGELITRIRHGQTAANPFMVIIALLPAASPVLVGRVIEAGADDLLLPAWLGRLVMDRLDNFVHGRKTFLITHDYVGPERRSFYREGEPAPATIEVPNPVQWLSTGKDDRAAFRKKVALALEAINLRKIKSHSTQLRRLADQIVAAFAAGGHQAILPLVGSLLESADELERRAANTEFAPAIELTTGLRTLSERLLREDREPRGEEISVLPSLADAVSNALYWHEKEPLPTAFT
jgi:CheY-like chemotaxis protein